MKSDFVRENLSFNTCFPQSEMVIKQDFYKIDIESKYYNLFNYIRKLYKSVILEDQDKDLLLQALTIYKKPLETEVLIINKKKACLNKKKQDLVQYTFFYNKEVFSQIKELYSDYHYQKGVITVPFELNKFENVIKNFNVIFDLDGCNIYLRKQNFSKNKLK